VTADRVSQIQRLNAERGLTPSEAETRIDAQGPQAEKVARADVVIDNGGEKAATEAQVLAAWRAVARGTAPSRRGENRD
jgi:dephospho-CoA kinase